MDSLVSEILDFLSLKTKPGTTRIPYNFSIYTIYSDLIAEVIHRSPNPTPTPWFPEGETGRFVNVGEERWKKSLEEWRAAENEEPVKKMSTSSIEGVVETIADDTLRRNKLPEPVNLDELLPLCDETWKYQGNR
ncbi:uncharacterized protein [Blastocystis hominis]|uniref:Uncharacterized protein n=1 Tax=Blastocystis hominis TaxID=12968 RepID=D8M3A9_BLAHO|nr:uncharacterized protein [Blastocystis hominis]CBK22382.2 unnamed protein product [Blastocystis hominis]|eukprot:XP_012896430.1 uncharacterized protein [Blastocystis hominis]